MPPYHYIINVFIIILIYYFMANDQHTPVDAYIKDVPVHVVSTVLSALFPRSNEISRISRLAFPSQTAS
jgi:hypothetical protein